MQTTEHRSFDAPDETREFPHGHAEHLKIGGGEVGMVVFEPGWRWSNDVKPIANTASCQAPHFQYHVSGRLAILMDDGTEFVAGPGTSPRCRAGTTRGWWGTSRSRSSTGSAPATTPRKADRTPEERASEGLFIPT